MKEIKIECPGYGLLLVKNQNYFQCPLCGSQIKIITELLKSPNKYCALKTEYFEDFKNGKANSCSFLYLNTDPMRLSCKCAAIITDTGDYETLKLRNEKGKYVIYKSENCPGINIEYSLRAIRMSRAKEIIEKNNLIDYEQKVISHIGYNHGYTTNKYNKLPFLFGQEKNGRLKKESVQKLINLRLVIKENCGGSTSFNLSDLGLEILHYNRLV